LHQAVLGYWYRSPDEIGALSRWFGRVGASYARARRRRFQRAQNRVWQAPAPVIVVGNLTLGGTGKTPLVIALVMQMLQRGYRPGVVLRGYGGVLGARSPVRVDRHSRARQVGDEAVLIENRTHCPIAVCANRVKAAQLLLATGEVNLIISDDGLQHYALGRDIEILVVSGSRHFGNQCCLPVGPLREPMERLDSVDFVVVNGGTDRQSVRMDLIPDVVLQPVGHNACVRSLDEIRDQNVHAICGIGEPGRFFSTLRQCGIDAVCHAFPDHYRYKCKDLIMPGAKLLLTTEKDAVKLARFADKRIYSLAVNARLPVAFFDGVEALL